MLFRSKPFIWQPYLQEDNAHILKLNAFLKIFYNDFSLVQTTAALYQAWAVQEFYQPIWQAYLSDLPEVREYTKQQSEKLVQQESLAPKLLAFCDNLVK